MKLALSTIECLVVGAGVIGLAVARALSMEGRDVLVLERETRVGTQTSSRNSEVVHAGIYYPPGSLKAQSCVAGAERLYRYCADRQISHRRCGKFIVATTVEQVAALQQLEANARQCGVTQLEWLSPSAARSLEPGLSCAAVLHSPSTGILDSHQYLLALLADAEAHGATIARGTELLRAAPGPHGLEVTVAGDSEPALACRWFINTAGLECTAVARRIRDFPARHIPRLHLAKGSYFTLAGRAPFSRLIYPLPDAGGLGVHMTLDLAGGARFGPDVEWIDAIDYEVHIPRARYFYDAIRCYWPALEDGRLQPAYAGVRPKLSGPGAPAQDFVISDPAQHGMPGVVNLFGIESPGLTASLDLAERVARIVRCQS